MRHRQKKRKQTACISYYGTTFRFYRLSRPHSLIHCKRLPPVKIRRSSIKQILAHDLAKRLDRGAENVLRSMTHPLVPFGNDADVPGPSRKSKAASLRAASKLASPGSICRVMAVFVTRAACHHSSRRWNAAAGSGRLNR